MALTPVVWLAWLIERAASYMVRAEVEQLRLELAEARDNALMLEADLRKRAFEVEAMEVQVNMLRQAEAANLQLVDHLVQTHGFNAGKT